MARQREYLPRTIVTLTLAADHRVSDGRRGAKFLSLIDAALKVPEAL
jgi:pyruvate dehydrogenase E2 component (dihydrolipoamide acetyltransferase)